MKSVTWSSAPASTPLAVWIRPLVLVHLVNHVRPADGRRVRQHSPVPVVPGAFHEDHVVGVRGAHGGVEILERGEDGLIVGRAGRLVEQIVARDPGVAPVMRGDGRPHRLRVGLVARAGPVLVLVGLARVHLVALAAEDAVHVDDRVDAALRRLLDKPIEPLERIAAQDRRGARSGRTADSQRQGGGTRSGGVLGGDGEIISARSVRGERSVDQARRRVQGQAAGQVRGGKRGRRICRGDRVTHRRVGLAG